MLKFLSSSLFRFFLSYHRKNEFHKNLILNLLSNVKYGRLRLCTPEKEVMYFQGQVDPDKIQADLNLKTWESLIITLTRGDIGFGESYMANDWSSNNLTNLLLFAIWNKEDLKKITNGKKIFLIYELLKHKFRFNSKRNAAQNIQAHYDLNNDFYKLFLDSTMTYSSAYFGLSNKTSLHDAQKNKINQIINSFVNKKGKFSVLEIGFGWGSFAKELLNKTPASYYGITLSKQQFDYVDNLLSVEIKQKKAILEIIDYRTVKGLFDVIVSIEMFEAVGKAYWSTFFKTLRSRLKPGGTAFIQTILIDEKKVNDYQRQVDFIQSYIFPGGMLASESQFKSKASKEKFQITNELWFGDDYAKTLKLWKEKFEQNLNQIECLGFDKKFCNMWRFYLSYCEAGFLSGDLKVAQFTLNSLR